MIDLPPGVRAIPIYRNTRQGGHGEDRIVAHALVDEADYAAISAHTWRLLPSGRTSYAVRAKHIGGRGGRTITTMMHRQILGLTDTKLQADHIDFNGMNNTRANLRAVTQKENIHHQRPCRKSRSGHVGVSFCPSRGRWVAYLKRDHRMILWQLHATKESAIEARTAALAHYESKPTQAATP